MVRLAPALDVDDLPAAELQAMRLDGQLFPLVGAWCPVDVAETPEVRARAMMSGRSARLVAELRAAAWIWGAIEAPPTVPQLCADVRARARVRPGADAVVREVVLPESDVVRFGDAGVTAPLRTAVDLARAGAEPAALRHLTRVGGFTFEAAQESLESRKLPGRKAALRALADALG
jgi:hypothetical protein